MFKSTIATLAAAAAFAAPGAALAGPYVNIEANAGWTGDDYTGYYRRPRGLRRCSG